VQADTEPNPEDDGRGEGRVFVDLENLTDVRQTWLDSLFLPERAADARWTTDRRAPLEGRVVNGGVRLSF
jgi:outer membrane receptor for ferrienterochelin and colicins